MNMEKFTRLMWLCSFFAFVLFLYVIAMQLTYQDSVYWGLAWWIPIRMDYLGESGFIASFIFAVAAVISTKEAVPA